MDFLNGFIQETQQEVVDGVQQLVESKGIKDKILNEAQDYAQKIANNIINPDSVELPKQFEGIALSPDTEDYLEYCLVMDYLDSIGLKFAGTVFRYESQNSNRFCDRFIQGEKLKLRSYDRTPLLVQMVEQIRLAQQNQ